MKRQRTARMAESPKALGENGAPTTRRRASLTAATTATTAEVGASPGFNTRKKRRQSVGRRVSFADPATLESVREFIKVRPRAAFERAATFRSRASRVWVLMCVTDVLLMLNFVNRRKNNAKRLGILIAMSLRYRLGLRLKR